MKIYVLLFLLLIAGCKDLKEKKSSISLKSSQAILIGLDKITAKSSKLIVNLNELIKFGPLEIKALKKLRGSINLTFASAVDLIARCKSKVIICGVGKSY